MTQYLRPSSTVAAGAWTFLATSLHGDTDEGVDAADDDLSYAECATEASTMELALDAGSVPTPGVAHMLRFRARRRGIHYDPGFLIVSLYLGAVLVATVPETGFDQTYLTAEYSLTTAEIAAISDYTDLRVRVVISQPIGVADLRVTALELSIDGDGGDTTSRISGHHRARDAKLVSRPTDAIVDVARRDPVLVYRPTLEASLCPRASGS